MRTLVIFTSLAAVLAAAPAAADTVPFSGPRVGVEVGAVSDDFAGTDRGTYGAVAGVDFNLGSVILGPTVGYTGLFDDEGTDVRELSAALRVGTRVAPRTQVYVAPGVSNLDADGVSSETGFRVGLGLEHEFPSGLTLGAETRYADYGSDAEIYQTAVAVGFRF